jgi:hypothetical protein
MARRKNKGRLKVIPTEVLNDVYPRMVISKDRGVTRYLVKKQNKMQEGDVSTPIKVWVNTIFAASEDGVEVLLSAKLWVEQGWQVVDNPFD